MKVLVYILIFQFSSGALMPLNDFSQLANIPYLIDHFNLHVKEAQEIGEDFTIVDFIYLHYISPDEHVHDTPYNHEDLPLKNINSSVTMCLNSIDELNLSPNTQWVDNDFAVRSFMSFEFNHSIFHPPLK